jgi:hypothetical protein
VVADPGSGIWCFFDPWIRDPEVRSGMEKNAEPGSGMNIPDLIFENLVSVFCEKIIKLFNADPGIRDIVHPGSGNRDPGCKKS